MECLKLNKEGLEKHGMIKNFKYCREVKQELKNSHCVHNMKVTVFGGRGSWDLVMEVGSVSEAKLQEDVRKRIQ